MDLSPTKIVKRKKDQAFSNFFGKGATQEVPKEELEDPADLEELMDKCCVCQTDLGNKKKKCGACNFYCCSQHIRKKRRDRTGTWSRICDDCQDRYLFQSYMKFELKAEEAIVMQEQIVSGKKKDVDEQLMGKQAKITVLKNQAQDGTDRFNEAIRKIMVTHNEFERRLAQLDAQEKQSQDFQTKMNDLQKSLPRSLIDDFEALKIEDEKITKELVKLEKRTNELIQAISQKEKDINQAYLSWQEGQKRKQKTQQEKCKVS